MTLQIRLKTIVKRSLNELGYDIYKLPSPDSSAPYEPVYPAATYSPWNTDREFRKVYSRIRENTLVDVYRCYELWTIAREVVSLPAGVIIEVGVWRGGTGALIAQSAVLGGMTDTVYLCDTFEGVTKASSLDTLYKGGEHRDTSEQIVKSLIAGFPDLRNVKILRGVFPDETAAQITESHVRMCHIDVDVYHSARDVFEWVWNRLVPGGVVVFDDYGFDGCVGVTRCVNELRDSLNGVVFHNLNGHAIIVKT